MRALATPSVSCRVRFGNEREATSPYLKLVSWSAAQRSAWTRAVSSICPAAGRLTASRVFPLARRRCATSSGRVRKQPEDDGRRPSAHQGIPVPLGVSEFSRHLATPRQGHQHFADTDERMFRPAESNFIGSGPESPMGSNRLRGRHVPALSWLFIRWACAMLHRDGPIHVASRATPATSVQHPLLHRERRNRRGPVHALSIAAQGHFPDVY